MKKERRVKQILAIIAIILLVGLYVASLVLSLVKNDNAVKMLKLSVLLTIIIPAWLYLVMMFYKLAHKNDKPEEIRFADEKDDPYTDEDFIDEEK